MANIDGVIFPKDTVVSCGDHTAKYILFDDHLAQVDELRADNKKLKHQAEMARLSYYWSWVFYSLVWDIFAWGGMTYLIYWHGASAWWYMLIAFLTFGTDNPWKVAT